MEKLDFNITNVPNANGCSLLLGDFDGLHLGHQKLFESASKEKTAVLVFDPSFPKEKENGGTVLASLDDKIRLFARYGADIAYVLKTDSSFFAMSSDDFVKKILLPMHPSELVVGEDYTFGKERQGKAIDLKKDFDTKIVPILRDMDGTKIGTREIKKLIANGEIEKANSYLGRRYEIVGKVRKGYQNGRKIGFPTANLSLNAKYQLPKDGVYSAISFLRGMPYRSIVNVGKAPTIGKLSESIVEIYLDGYSGECYDETIYLDFSYRIRDEKRFSSLEELKRQLQSDLSQMRSKL